MIDHNYSPKIILLNEVRSPKIMTNVSCYMYMVRLKVSCGRTGPERCNFIHFTVLLSKRYLNPMAFLVTLFYLFPILNSAVGLSMI